MNNFLNISGLVVSTVLMIIFVAWLTLFLLKYKKILNFSKEKNRIYQNKTVFWSLIGIISGAGLLYLFCLIFGILVIVKQSENNVKSLEIVFEIFFLLYVLLLLIFLIIYIIFESSLIISLINDNLVTMTAVIQTKNILQIRTNPSRHYIFVNWNKVAINDYNPKNLVELKLRYNYKIKDFLKQNNLWKEETEK